MHDIRMTPPKCQNCPVSGVCIVQTNGHTRACDMVHNPAWRDKIVRESENRKMPPLLTQAGNLLTAAKNVLTSEHVNLTDEQKATRLAACESCVHFSENRRCFLCGCFVDAKVLLASEACPDNPPRWLAVKSGATCKPCTKS